MSGLTLLLVSFLLLVLVAVPIPFAIGLSSLLILLIEPRLDPWLLTQRSFAGISSFILTAVPMFLFTGLLMSRAGITRYLIDFANAVVGSIRGGLAHVNVFVSMLFAGVSGSSTADTAGLGSILIPAMRSQGFRTDFSVAVTAASSTLGQIIPPSIIMVIYGATVDTSIGALFLAGIVPGLLVGFAQMGLVYRYAVKEGYPRQPRARFGELLTATRAVLLPMGTPVIIIGGITGGVFTPTEASAVAAFYTVFLAAVVYRTLTWRGLWEVCRDTGYISSLTLFTIGIAGTFGYVSGYYRLSSVLAEILSFAVGSPELTMLTLIAIFLVVGFVLDAAPAIIVLMPVLAPIAVASGLHPVHVGVVVVLTLALGLVTPPYGLCLLLACAIGNVSVVETMRVMIPFILVILVIILATALIPEISMSIPKLVVPKFL
jgi:tripartite ATP-independent transporter DctM subunit